MSMIYRISGANASFTPLNNQTFNSASVDLGLGGACGLKKGTRVVILVASPSSHVPTITDSAGNVYTLHQSVASPPFGCSYLWLFSTVLAADMPAGGYARMTYPGPFDGGAVGVTIYGNAAGPADAGAAAAGTSSPFNSGPATITGDEVVLVGLTTVSGNPNTAAGDFTAAGWTLLSFQQSALAGGLFLVERRVAAGNYSLAGTVVTSGSALGQWSAVFQGFQAGAGGGISGPCVPNEPAINPAPTGTQVGPLPPTGEGSQPPGGASSSTDGGECDCPGGVSTSSNSGELAGTGGVSSPRPGAV